MSRKNRRNREEKRKVQQQNAAAGQGAAPTPENARKCPPFLEKIRKEKAAQLLAEGELTQSAICSVLGVDEKTIYRWKHEPEFAARLEELKRDVAELEKRFLVTRKSFRLGDLQELILSLHQLKAARSNLPAEHGGDSGLVVCKKRMLGSGENAILIDEYVFDAALAKEWREALKHVAQEIGDWTEKKEIGGPDGAPLVLQIVEEIVEADGTSDATTENQAASRAE